MYYAKTHQNFRPRRPPCVSDFESQTCTVVTSPYDRKWFHFHSHGSARNTSRQSKSNRHGQWKSHSYNMETKNINTTHSKTIKFR